MITHRSGGDALKAASVEALVRALNAFEVRFLIAGGLAVVAHGYLRSTKDADIVVELTPENVKASFDALASLGYRPLVPVTASQLGDAATRRALIEDKGMQVLQFWSDAHRETPVDVFVDFPFDFEAEFANALVKPTSNAGNVRFVSIPVLIRMKEIAGRSQDLTDIEHLKVILEDNG
jgi:hypothetical protein